MTKFRSTTGNTEHVALASGHAAQVPPEGIELHSRFHQAAIAANCLPINANEYEAPAPGTGNFNREQVIYDSLHQMLESSDPGAFTQNNKPSMKVLSDLCGFRVGRDESASIWERVEHELQSGEIEPGATGADTGGE